MEFVGAKVEGDNIWRRRQFQLVQGHIEELNKILEVRYYLSVTCTKKVEN